MKNKLFFTAITILSLMLTNCTTINKTIREPNSKVEFKKDDFLFSNQIMAEATTVKVFGIDFPRMVLKKKGSVDGSRFKLSASIPVIGNMITDYTANYALFNLMNDNSGYDVVFYPQYETKVFKPVLGIGFLTKITTVKISARLGKLK